MASNFAGSINRGSDLFFEFHCFICQENERNTEAELYCEECSRFNCSKCVEHHNYLYKKHTILGKENISQWPETNVDALEQCQEHRKEKLTGFCEDHSQLVCHACHINNHQKCRQVVHIADKVKDLHQNGDFKQLSTSFDTQHQQLIQMKDDFEKNMKSLEKSYKKILEEINALRKAINDSLNLLEKNTKKELDTCLATMKTCIQNDIENCTKSIKNTTCLNEDLLRSKDKSEALSLIKYRKCLDQSLKVEVVVQEMTTKNERTLAVNPDTTIQQTLSTLSGLGQMKQSQTAKRTTQNTVTGHIKPKASSQSDPGNQTTPVITVKKSNLESSSSKQYNTGNQPSDVTKPGQVSDPISSSSHQLVQGYQPGAVSKPDHIVKVKSSEKYNVKIERNSHKCFISDICETATGEILITDYMNKRVKLLDHTLKVVAHCDLPDRPKSMCSIDSSLVAVALANREVHFIRMTNAQLVKDHRRTPPVYSLRYSPLIDERSVISSRGYPMMVKDRILKLQHSCYGIAHHQGNLYITDGSALYHYTLDGGLVSKMYEDTSDKSTVRACAVSQDGDRIYMANQARKQLVTRSRNGTVISTFTDPALDWGYLLIPPGLHVTDSGQVLVCGGYSNTILQVDRDGRGRLAEVVTQKDGVICPSSVYYSKHTCSLIVGMANNDYIILFKTR